MNKNLKRSIIFVVIFTVIGFIAMQIPAFKIVGSDAKFNAFDFMAPGAGLLIGSIWGMISVFLVKLISLIINYQEFDWFSVLRLFPLALAALYFGSKGKKTAIIPLACIALFWLHPVGQKAWYYALYWLIPLVASLKKDRLIFNALGATFTAHAVGSTAFLYTVNAMTPEMWLALVPVVFMERMMFAVGIWVSYIVFNNVLEFLVEKLNWKFLQVLVNKHYVVSKYFLKHYA